MSDLVTVYIPSNNRPDMAERAIRSVLNQSYEAIELIFCDDGSDYASYQGVRELLAENSAKYIRHEFPRGACAARNSAIMIASGEFITGLDDDDEFAPSHVDNLVRAFSVGYSFVASSYTQITSRGHAQKRYGIGEISLDAQLHYNRVGNQVLTKTERLRAVGMFDEELPAMQDYDVWIRLLIAYGPGFKLSDCTYIQHLDHEGERISADLSKLAKAFKTIQSKYRDMYTPEHLSSHRIMESKLSQKRMSIGELLSSTNKHNFWWSLALYTKLTKKLLNGANRSVPD